MIHMRPYNDFEARNVKFLVDKQVQFVTLQITETGLKKSILDATAPVRAYLKETGIHDYTGVGRTVETLLGIHMNADTIPDYKGIELKSHREASRVRNTLFTQSPEWEISRLKSGKAIVEGYGYVPEGYDHKSLHVTLSTNKPNSQSLGLLVVPQKGILEADEFSPIQLEDGSFQKIKDVVVWRLSKLHERLLIKHRETFWIDAETKKEHGKEYFRCTEILHTKNPIPAQFDVLLDQGQITVDFLLCRRSGRDTYSFKIKSGARGLLFPQSETYNLRAI